MIASDELIRWQSQAVILWHQQPVSQTGLLARIGNSPQPLMEPVLLNHQLNFQLWHEEDSARDPAATDAVIAAVKRRIDALNQQRNNAIEQIDQAIANELASRAVHVEPQADFNTETPGSAIDRLSILALRLYHLQERCDATTDPVLVAKIRASLQLCRAQRDRLATALERLLADIFAGRRRHEPFYQLKMYNDPQLNPVLVSRTGDAAALVSEAVSTDELAVDNPGLHRRDDPVQ